MALGLASTAYANLCSNDVVPASTLLFPFVIYDYENEENGDSTLFAITNVSSEAQIVHITVWTDFSVAILDFNLVLTGYDVQTMNIRDLLRDGVLPHEGNGANIWEQYNWGYTGVTPNPPPTPFDDGPYSTFNELWDTDLNTYFSANGLPDPQNTWDGVALSAFPLDCDPAVWDSSPNNYQAAGNIPSGTLALFETYLKRSQDADKWYEDCVGDEIEFDVDPWFLTRTMGPVWLYITADVVGACNKDLPDGALEYYNQVDREGVIDENVLIGDIIYLNPGQNYSEAINAVHLEAADGFGATYIPELDEPTGLWSQYSTFYLRYHATADPATYRDGREPLPTAWAFRYIVAPTASAKTWIRAWKGGTLFTRVQDLNDGVITTQNPDELYANSCIPYTYYAWDEDEGVNAVGPGFTPPWSGGPTDEPIPVPNLLPLETQQVDAEEFFLVGDPAAGAFGWMLFIWPRSNWDGVNPTLVDYYQTWMGVKYAMFGTYTAGLEGAVMGNFNCFTGDQLPQLGLGRYSE
jgi:hypothetical protein